MGRKSNAKDHVSSPPETKNIINVDSNDFYRKRLRSWNQPSTKLKSNRISVSSAINNDEVTPLHRSTIYTYPVNFNSDRQCILSNTMLSESLTTESAFYCPSISYTSVQTMGDLNNNHVTTLNIEKKKRKNNTSSCESLSGQLSQMNTFEMLPNPNDEKHMITQQSSINNLQLTYHQSPTKRSRMSTDDSIITNHRCLNSPLPIDGDTIDINQVDQQEPLSSSINNESLINNSNSMEVAVKMVQPIVDIIFNAFEVQLKNVQTSSLSNSSSISPSTQVSSQQLHPPMTIPYFPLTPPAHPIVLHAVNFNIQLTTKQPIMNSMEKQSSTEQYLANATLNENTCLQSISLTEFKRKVVSCILSNNVITDHQANDNNQSKIRKLKRIVQLAAIGVSVLCGYLLL